MSDLEKPVLMKLPDNTFVDAEPYVWVSKSLYGFHASAVQWLKLLTAEVLKLDPRMKQIPTDTCLFVLHDPKQKLFILMCVHVDDIYAISSDIVVLEELLSKLDTALTERGGGVTVQSDAAQYVGVTMTEVAGGIYFSGPRHVQSLLDDWDSDEVKPKTTPFPTGLRIVPLKPEEKISKAVDFALNSFVGLVRYQNRHDIRSTYAIAALAIVQDAPTAAAVKAVTHFVGYVKANPHYALYFKRLPRDKTIIAMEAWADVSFACCSVTRRSLGSLLVMINGHVVMHSAFWIKRIMTSTAQAEMYCLSKVCKDVVFLLGLFQEFQLEVEKPVPLWCDSMSTIYIAENNIINERTRHFEIDELYVRQYVDNGTVMPKWCDTKEQLADYFNKPHSAERCAYFNKRLGMVNIKNLQDDTTVADDADKGLQQALTEQLAVHETVREITDTEGFNAT